MRIGRRGEAAICAGVIVGAVTALNYPGPKNVLLVSVLAGILAAAAMRMLIMVVQLLSGE